MLGFGNKKDKKVREKHRFEKPYDNHQSEWRKPQGIYMTDVDAKKRLVRYLSRLLFGSQLLSLFLMVVLFTGISYMLLFGHYENVIFDDGSRLFCTILEDGTVGIAY